MENITQEIMQGKIKFSNLRQSLPIRIKIDEIKNQKHLSGTIVCNSTSDRIQNKPQILRESGTIEMQKTEGNWIY
jgi:hypothetical protein